ncbi:homeobox protein B-H2-like, partial [Rhagoletis pomonella]|uniref:homeobox protein B-H2-like n=1 Tax=Rhagoletis pomonella TaxID=28610 RepID=UPI00177C0257
MQHHAHVARTAPPHMRAHHMAVPPPHSQTQSHMPPLNMTHVPPPSTGQQQQQLPLQSSQQQNQPQHLTNGPAPCSGGGSSAVITGSKIGAPSHIRDHHTRLNQQALQQHQPQHPPSMHNSTQLQKLRQQHQHINNNNNSSSGVSGNGATKTATNSSTAALQAFDFGSESCSLRRSRSLAVIREETFSDLQITTANNSRRSQLIPRARIVNRGFIRERERLICGAGGGSKHHHHHHH